MGTAVGIGIGIGRKRKNWSPNKPLGGETPNFWYKEGTRNGLSLPDSLGGDPATINLPYFHKPSANEYYSISDNGALDIGATDFTLFAKFRSITRPSSISDYCVGKLISTPKIGRFGFYVTTAGYCSFNVQSSGTNVSISDNIDNTGNWVFLIGKVNQSTKKVSFFLNGVQIGSDTSFSGTIDALSNIYKFYIGAGQTVDPYLRGCSKTDHADTGLLNRLTTPTEDANMLLGIFPSDCKAYWPLLSIEQTAIDASGNGYHLTGTNIVKSTNTGWSADGSKHGLTKGFTIYSNGYNDVYVPLEVGGDEIIPILDAGYKKTKEGIHAGNTTDYNLANAMIDIPGDSWDRSDVLIYSDFARLATTQYIAATPNYWHPSELNNILIQSWKLTGYKGTDYVKVSDHSYKDRKILKEIFSFASDKTGSNYSKAIKYCNDYVFTDTYENDYIYWKYESNAIITARGNSQVKWENAATDKLYLSLDNGATYPYSINSPQNGQVPRFAHIFANGNIYVAFTTKIYLSTDNLTTINEVIVKDVNGDIFVGTSESFFSVEKDKYVSINGVELLAFGSYQEDVGSETVNVNVFYTIDSGVTLKSFYLADTTSPDLPARHIHAVIHNPSDDSFWFLTGDNNAPATNECNIIKSVYDWDLDSWTCTKLYGSGTLYKLGMIGFFGDNIVATDDDTSSGTYWGIWKCAIDELSDKSNVEVVYKISKESSLMFCHDPVIISSAGNESNTCILQVSSTGVDGIIGHKLFGLPDDTYNFYLPQDKNANGWYLSHVLNSTLARKYVLSSGVLWVKIK
jgi:hypothetical protein